MKVIRSAILLLLYYLPITCHAQNQGQNQNPDPSDASGGELTSMPNRFFTKLQNKTASLDKSITHQTEKYLRRMAKREEKLYRKLYRVDSNAAKSLFAGTTDRYAALNRQLAQDTGGAATPHLAGEYQAYTDSLQGMLKFLKTGPDGFQAPPQLQSSLRQFQSLQEKMQTADQIKAYVHEREQNISQYIQQHTDLSRILGKDFQGLHQEAYYYTQQVREYKTLLNDPDKLTKKMLEIVNNLPAFQTFMKQNSMLAGLFNLPGNYGDPATLAGLQTRDQVAALIRQQVSAGGSGGMAALQGSIQSAQSQLDGYKDKLNKLGGGSGDMEMPNFKPNQQKTKSFWRRLEYNTNLQTTRSSYYYPSILDLGLGIGYRFSEKATAGLGTSFKLGTGNGIEHISFSGRGASIRSYFDIKLKGSFWASGGLEYNYLQPYTTFRQIRNLRDWDASGLIGISKIISTKSKTFKKTKLQLLWDFLNYRHPQEQPIKFRVGYNL